MTKRTSANRRLSASTRPATRGQRLWLPSTMVVGTAAVLWSLLGGVVSCDSTAKFSLPDRKFQDIQVVSAFPAVIENGVVRRVCGAPLEGEEATVPDAVELTVNFKGSGLNSPLCDKDGDLSIKEGELIELQPVKTTNPGATVGPNNFQVQVDCIQPRGPAKGVGACSTLIANATLNPTHVAYENITGRCDPKRVETRVNLALIIDRSGSTAGWVDADSLEEDQVGDVNLPSELARSDYQNARLAASNALLDSLNLDHDRTIGYYFDEKIGTDVAASDQRYCDGGALENKKCLFDNQCVGGFNCEPGSGADPVDPVTDTFKDLTLTEQENKAFGAKNTNRRYLDTALADKATRGGEGRAPLWHSVGTAYEFLKSKLSASTAKARHILVITDGPDTCSHSESFAYKNTAGVCRVPCLTANKQFQELLKAMHADGFPIRIHFIQFQAQAQAYRQPDAGMMELACRSGGTYQFINSQEINQKEAGFADAVLRAALKVRYTLSGSWKVTFPMKQFGVGGDIKVGAVHAMRGNLQFKNQKFLGLDSIYNDSTAWKFGIDKNLDGRLLFRTSCTKHADCGGTTECAAQHCSADGLCVSGPAPDRLPCADGAGVCCNGACDTSGGGCKQGCK